MGSGSGGGGGGGGGGMGYGGMGYDQTRQGVNGVPSAGAPNLGTSVSNWNSVYPGFMWSPNIQQQGGAGGGGTPGQQLPGLPPGQGGGQPNANWIWLPQFNDWVNPAAVTGGGNQGGISTQSTVGGASVPGLASGAQTFSQGSMGQGQSGFADWLNMMASYYQNIGGGQQTQANAGPGSSSSYLAGLGY